MTTPFQLEVREYVKAIVGGLLAAIPFLIQGINSNGLSQEEVLVSVLTGLGAFLGVFYAPNQDARGDLSTQAGATQGQVVILIAIFLVIILGVFAA